MTRPMVLALFTLVLTATSASAECAWVLWWGRGMNASGDLVALPLGGWNSRNECEQERLKREQTARQPRATIFTCIPDTVDPRGSKGK